MVVEPIRFLLWRRSGPIRGVWSSARAARRDFPVALSEVARNERHSVYAPAWWLPITSDLLARSSNLVIVPFFSVFV